MAEYEIFRREFRLESTDKADDRTIEFSLSSDKPVSRWFGNEILSHDPKHIRTERLQSGAPLLLNHNWDDQIGVIDSFSIGDGKIRVKARFSRSERAEEIYRDVIDKIRPNVSIGYLVHDFTECGKDMLVTDWEPLEGSIVSIPADISVGVGRSKLSKLEDTQMTDKTTAPEVRQQEAAPKTGEVVDIQALRNDTRKAEIERIKEINALGDAHGMRDLAQQHAAQDTSIDAFRGIVLGEIAKRSGASIKPATPFTEIGLDKKEKRAYSLVRMLDALSDPTNQKLQDKAGLELEASAAVGKEIGRTARGFFIPPEIMGHRGQTVGDNTAGGYLVGTQELSMIEKLEKRMVTRSMGVRVLTGLSGNIAIPKKTGGTTMYWLGEGDSLTESSMSFGQLGMTPKTAGVHGKYSRSLLKQSSYDVEMWLRDDMMLRQALGLDLALINGNGTDKQPRGLLNYTGIGSVVGGTNGAAPDWADIVGLETAVAVDDADVGSLGYIINSATRGKLKTTEKVSNTGIFLMPDTRMADGRGTINGYPVGVSNQVPSNLVKGSSGAVCSAIIFGNWDDLVLGMWGVMDVTVDPYTLAATGETRIIMYQDFDIQMRHEQSFAAMKDALTA